MLKAPIAALVLALATPLAAAPPVPINLSTVFSCVDDPFVVSVLGMNFIAADELSAVAKKTGVVVTPSTRGWLLHPAKETGFCTSSLYVSSIFLQVDGSPQVVLIPAGRYTLDSNEVFQRANEFLFHPSLIDARERLMVSEGGISIQFEVTNKGLTFLQAVYYNPNMKSKPVPRWYGKKPRTRKGKR